MAKVLYPPACDAELLSAYRDEALDAAQQRRLDHHLATCPGCRQELLQYERLSVGLRHLAGAGYTNAVPSAFIPRAWTPPAPRARGRATKALLSASLAATLAFIVLGQRLPQRPAALFEAYPSAGASDVSTDTSIIITFQHPVNQAQIQRTLQFQPQVSFGITWESAQRADVIPVLPLAPSTTYTLLAAVPVATVATPPTARALAPGGDALPQTLTVFQTASQSAAEGGPVPVLARAGLVSWRQPSSVSQAVLAVPATPSPVSLPSTALRPADAAGSTGQTSAPFEQPQAAGVPSPLPRLGAESANGSQAPALNNQTTSASALAESMEQPALLPPCAPANVFTPIYTSRGDVRSALGCVAGTTRTTTLVTQDFQRGLLLVTLPGNVLYELTDDGIWRAAPLGDGGADSPLTAGERAIGPAFRSYWHTDPVL
ncbi:MAG TPA: zf-HC2 domain-containing protein, partial [Chloroflexota bacterium]